MRSVYILGLVFAALASPAGGQTRITQSGPVPHVAAAAVFPERVGEFRRTSVVKYDAEGRDMSAGYNLVTPKGRLTVTVYIYPPRQDAAAGQRAAACRQEFEANVREISSVQAYRNLRRDPAAALPPLPGVSPDLSHGAAFRFRTTFDEPDQALQSAYRLYCYVGGTWLVKYRATSPEGFDGAQALEQFIRTGPWPGRGSPETTVAAPRAENAG
jgi:hypothetical protein